MSLVSNCSSSILLTSGEGSCKGFALVPGGSSPDASSNNVACRRLCWMFSKCYFGVVPFTVDLSPFCVGSGSSVDTSFDRKYVLNVSWNYFVIFLVEKMDGDSRNGLAFE